MVSFSPKSVLRGLLAATALVFGLGSANAASVAVSLTNIGTIGGTTAFRADLTGLGLTQIGSLTIVDSNSGAGGSPGIFSGFDLDAVFLDTDGLLATVADRVFGSSFVFAAGATRATSSPAFLPNAAHPGPTFGSLSANTIDLATATLNVFDGVPVADVNQAAGFLTLGDGGSLSVNFAPATPVGAFLYLLVGEVGTQAGESIRAQVLVSENQVPEPGALSLIGLGLVGVVLARRRTR